MNRGEEILKARDAAIAEALKELRDGMVIGLGSGTTIARLMERLKNYVKRDELKLSFIPSSLQAKQLIIEGGFKLTSLDEYPRPDLVLDSFDQVDDSGNAIKGGGGALLREKVLAQAAERVVYIGDFMKLKPRLDMPIPVEVLEYAFPHVKSVLNGWGMEIRLRFGKGKMGPIISDNGNLIADVKAKELENPEELDERLRSIAGILETGIFPRLADLILIGYPRGEVKRIIVERRKIF
ncbi:MAG: ribose 5-phosphate isomerase A [Thermoplasmata archaeon]|nr:MAG: ribose 5-phosphate isomerase A [Thermoplasmata archaeon]